MKKSRSFSSWRSANVVVWSNVRGWELGPMKQYECLMTSSRWSSWAKREEGNQWFNWSMPQTSWDSHWLCFSEWAWTRSQWDHRNGKKQIGLPILLRSWTRTWFGHWETSTETKEVLGHPCKTRQSSSVHYQGSHGSWRTGWSWRSTLVGLSHPTEALRVEQVASIT